MCTVIIGYSPGSDSPLVVGANRDERKDRPSSHFGMRDGGSALYPLDVGGGTWIGANRVGLFVAITNRDDVKDARGRESRGLLVRKALGDGSVSAMSEWADRLDPWRYNGFRLIAADRRSLVIWESDGSSDRIVRTEPGTGLHVVTGFGVDTWDIPRCRAVREALAGGFMAYDLRRVLAMHATGRMEDDVCVHDPRESHVTVSSCTVSADAGWGFSVDAVPAPPCSREPWDSWVIGPGARP